MHRSRLVWLAVTWLSGALILISAQVKPAGAADLQSVHFIDVGQGDCILLMDGKGYEVLIDAGKRGNAAHVIQTLLDKGITHLETMAVTHADADHVGGLIGVLQSDQISVGEVVYTGYPGDTNTWNDFVAAVNSEGLSLTTVQYPAELSWGEMRVYVLNPPSGLGEPETNAASLVLRVDYGLMRYLLTGDINTEVELEVIARQTPVASSVLKVAHHGSAGSSGDEFLAEVQPDEAVISVGANSYGHPSPLTLERLSALEADIWRTDLAGDVDVSTDGLTHYWVEDQWNALAGGAFDEQLFLPVVIK